MASSESSLPQGLDEAVLVVEARLEFHTYRMESPANSSNFEVFIDGVSVYQGTAAPNSNSGFGWGDTTVTAANGGNVDWDYVQVLNDGAVPTSDKSFGSVKALFHR